MPLNTVDQRRTLRVAPQPYRLSDPHATTSTLCKLLDTDAPRMTAAAPSVSHALPKAPQGGVHLRGRKPAKQDQTEQADRAACAYNRLCEEQVAFMAAGPSQWLQRSIDRVDGGKALVTLLKNYATTQIDVSGVEDELARHPMWQQLANRWMVRLSTSDVDRAVAIMGEVTMAEAIARAAGRPHIKPSLGRLALAGLRMIHASLRRATWVDMSHKGLTDDHLRGLLPFYQLFEGLKGLDLSHNAITDAHLPALAEKLQANSLLLELDLRGNPITDSGVRTFNAVAKTSGRGLILDADLQASNIELFAPANLDALRAQESVAFEVEFSRPFQAACGCAETGAAALAALTLEPGVMRHMGHLDLSGKTWQEDDINGLAEVLRRDGMRLTSLSMSESVLPPNGTQKLAQALSGVRQLTTLHLRHVAIDEAGDAALEELVRQIPTITHIASDAAPRTSAALLARAGYDAAIKPEIELPPAPTGAWREDDLALGMEARMI